MLGLAPEQSRWLWGQQRVWAKVVVLLAMATMVLVVGELLAEEMKEHRWLLVLERGAMKRMQFEELLKLEMILGKEWML